VVRVYGPSATTPGEVDWTAPRAEIPIGDEPGLTPGALQTPSGIGPRGAETPMLAVSGGRPGFGRWSYGVALVDAASGLAVEGERTTVTVFANEAPPPVAAARRVAGSTVTLRVR